MLHDVIQKVSNDFLSEAKNSPRLFEDMASMEKYMAESYGGRVFIELLQNADDANSRKIILCDYDGHLIFANNGRPFNENDVIAISRSGVSSKDRGTTIGYRGIGFKSTTYLTNEIIIYSDDTWFTFSKSICSKKLNIHESKIPTVRIPFLIDNQEARFVQLAQSLSREGYTTIFIFKNVKLEDFVEEVKEINNGYFLFLRNISLCLVKVKDQISTFKINRIESQVGTIVSMAGDKKEQWLILGKTKAKLAFKFEEGKIIPCNEDEAVYHSYLPTLDKVIFPLKISGDFSTDPSRKHITIDDNTTQTLDELAQVLTKLVSRILSEPGLHTYSTLLTILSQRLSFSRLNSIFSEKFTCYLTRLNWVRIGSDSRTIYPAQYKMLPDWLEESERIFIRTYSKYVRAQSLSEGVYRDILQVDSFLQQFSQCNFTVEDLIEILREADFVIRLSAQTQGKIIANIIKTARSKEYISGENYKLGNIMIFTGNKLYIISEISKDATFHLDSFLKDAINQYASLGDIEWFCKKIFIDENLIKNETSLNFVPYESEKKKVVINNKPALTKWRSAEQQCLEIEKYDGNEAIDVSLQNVGYDVESTTKNGIKRYIEVKSINGIGMPFSLTNNEYTAAHQYGENYFLCLIVQGETKLTAIYIKNPLASLQLQKRIRQWEWYCEKYQGETISFDL